MQYVNLGKSGLKVSRLCLGMMTYGTSKWRPWVLDEKVVFHLEDTYQPHRVLGHS